MPRELFNPHNVSFMHIKHFRRFPCGSRKFGRKSARGFSWPILPISNGQVSARHLVAPPVQFAQHKIGLALFEKLFLAKPMMKYFLYISPPFL